MCVSEKRIAVALVLPIYGNYGSYASHLPTTGTTALRSNTKGIRRLVNGKENDEEGQEERKITLKGRKVFAPVRVRVYMSLSVRVCLTGKSELIQENQV